MNAYSRIRILAALVLFASLLGSPLPARAQNTTTTEIIVKGTVDEIADDGNCTLREAILAANTDSPVDRCPAGSGADVIILPTGVYPLAIEGTLEDLGLTGDLDITAPVMIRGTGSGATIVGFSDSTYHYWRDRILQVHSGAGLVTLQNLTLQDSTSFYDGAAIHNSAELHLEDCRLLDNGERYYATYRGGALYNAGELWLVRSAVSGNYSISGALYNLGTAYIQGSTVNGNLGDDGNWGSAITNHGQMSIQTTLVTGNYGGGGSGILNSGTLRVVDSHLDHNSARFTSPALANGGTAELINTTLDGNGSGHWTGALTNSGVLTITHGSISGNSSYNWAGAIEQTDGRLYLEDVQLNNNRTGGEGGGLYAAGQVDLVNVQVLGNASTDKTGGGLYLINATLTLRDSTVSDNRARGNGAGIFLQNTQALLQGVTVQGNRIDLPTYYYGETNHGGGIYQTGGALTLADSQVLDNYTIESGGGLYLNGSALITDTLISGNQAALSGGGIANLGDLSLSAVEIRANQAGEHGGGASNSGSLALDHLTVHANTAGGWGGGLYQSGGSLELANVTLGGNTAAAGGGLGLQGGSASLNFVTLSANHLAAGLSGAGAGLAGENAALTVHAALLAGNLAESGAPEADCRLDSVTLNNLGANLVGIVDGCNWVSAPGDLTGSLADPLDARLFPLSPLGGSQPVFALLHASPALDGVDPAACLPDDQRGLSRPQGAACEIGAVEAESLGIAIDIKPGTTRNVIDRTSPFRVPVALLSSPTFLPAGQVDPATITFGQTGYEDSLFYLGSKRICQWRDLNQDGQLDLICEFVIARTNFQCGDTLGYLHAYGYQRQLLAGQDTVIIIPCGK